MEKATICRRDHHLWPICAALCLLGALTGTVIFARAYSEADIAAFAETQTALPPDFLKGFASFLRRELIFLVLVVLMSCFVFGWLALPMLLVYRGLGVGIGVCCLFDACGWLGALYGFAVLVLPTAVALAAHTLVSRDALIASFGIFQFWAGRNALPRGITRLLAKIPLSVAVMVCAASLSAAVRIPLHTILLLGV